VFFIEITDERCSPLRIDINSNVIVGDGVLDVPQNQMKFTGRQGCRPLQNDINQNHIVGAVIGRPQGRMKNKRTSTARPYRLYLSLNFILISPLSRVSIPFSVSTLSEPFSSMSTALAKKALPFFS